MGIHNKQSIFSPLFIFHWEEKGNHIKELYNISSDRDIKKVERNQNGLLFLMMQTVTLFYRVVFKQQSLIHVISQCGTWRKSSNCTSWQIVRSDVLLGRIIPGKCIEREAEWSREGGQANKRLVHYLATICDFRHIGVLGLPRPPSKLLVYCGILGSPLKDKVKQFTC